jgi:hypothetical protein
LVLSLHGNTGILWSFILLLINTCFFKGTGKNHVSKIVANSLFKYGIESGFVQILSATTTFGYKNKVPKYRVLIF